MKGKRLTKKDMVSITNLLYICTMIAGLLWVTTSYAIAIYSTVRLGVVYTMSELSEPAITVLLVALITKVGGNIFEHNDGFLFGKSKPVSESDTSDL